MGITHHRYGSDNVRAIVNLQLARGNVGRPHTGLMPIRGHSGVQGGAEMGGQPGAYVMGFLANEANAKKFAGPDMWGFEPPAWKGLSAAHMVLAAERGELDAAAIGAVGMEANRAMFGDSVELRPDYAGWWSYIPHFVHTPFYCYAYSYGVLLVLALVLLGWRRRGHGLPLVLATLIEHPQAAHAAHP